MESDLTWVYLADLVKGSDDDRMVYGKVTGPAPDLDLQACDPQWLQSALPKWFQQRGNMRLQHRADSPIGKGKQLVLDPNSQEWFLSAKVVDDNAWKLVKEDVLTGMSVGIKNPFVEKTANLKNGFIKGGTIIEVSLVDHPSYEGSTMSRSKENFPLLKSAGAGKWLYNGAVIEDVMPDPNAGAISYDGVTKAAGAQPTEKPEAPHGGSAQDWTLGTHYTRPWIAGPGTTPEEAVNMAKRVENAAATSVVLPANVVDTKTKAAQIVGEIEGLMRAVYAETKSAESLSSLEEALAAMYLFTEEK